MVDRRGVIAVVAIGLGCAVALAAANRFTEAPIARNETARERAMLAALVGAGADEALPIPDLSRSPAIWRLCGQTLLARLDLPGYAGPIKALFTVTALPDQAAAPAAAEHGYRLGRIVLLAHQETPGITDFLQGEVWLAGLSGHVAKDLGGWDAVTGATITSRAVTGVLARVLAMPDELGPMLQLECGR